MKKLTLSRVPVTLAVRRETLRELSNRQLSRIVGGLVVELAESGECNAVMLLRS